MEILPPEMPEIKEAPKIPATRIPHSHWIFFGPDGLRAGWSMLVFVAVCFGLFTLVGFEMRWFVFHTHQQLPGRNGEKMRPAISIVIEATTLLAVMLATALMAWFEHRRVASYGLLGHDRVRQFFIGILTGFSFLSLLVGILVATHHLQLQRVSISPTTLLRYAAAWALLFFLVGITEEFLLRGYALFTLARGIRFWPAAILLAAMFGLLHKGNPGESPFGLVAAALIALVLSLSLWRLGHLWWAIGFHASWDWAESFFYGTADSGTVSAGRMMHAHPTGAVLLSGGATGPEGSVWVVLIVALVALFVWTTQPCRGIHLAKNPNPATPPGI
jgi:membrane protease YdiL (CAAX protease family)